MYERPLPGVEESFNGHIYFFTYIKVLEVGNISFHAHGDKIIIYKSSSTATRRTCDAAELVAFTRWRKVGVSTSSTSHDFTSSSRCVALSDAVERRGSWFSCRHYIQHEDRDLVSELRTVRSLPKA